MDLQNRANSPAVISARAMLAQRRKPEAVLTSGKIRVELRRGEDAIYAALRGADGGGLSLRLADLMPDARVGKARVEADETVSLVIESAAGLHRVTLAAGGGEFLHIRATVRFTPAAPFRPSHGLRDLIPFDRDGEPLATEGTVEASQNGPNSGLVFLHLDRPALGHVLYLQNFTPLNPYFVATGTTPCDTVGGTWPELGYRHPISEEGLLPAGEEVVLSDVVLAVRPEAQATERESARHFLQLLAECYRLIDKPQPEFRNWIERSEQTLQDLDSVEGATVRHYGHRYVRPYMAGEYPDNMVQMTLVSAIHDWGRWQGQPHPLEREFRLGMRKFFDPKLQVLRRYLPNVGKEKNADAVDSWYLYHPLINLGHLALHGERHAREWFFRSLEFGIQAAQHFDYKWPVQYDIRDFSIITDVAEADGRGQTDVGGIYAWVMLQAFTLSGDNRYLEEAEAAIEAALGLRFSLNYQANLTAWGAAACMRLWRITGREVYREQSYVYLADFFHNCQMWESEIGHARHYKNFLAVTCLQDAPYMAMYECFESFAAFEHYLEDSGPDLDPAARMLVSEYCKYVLDRAWYYYPDALPDEAISPEQREANGYIDRKASFPLEDLYPDGQQAGQVGQEVYGAGAAMVFASRAFHHVEQAPFRLFCNHFARSLEQTGPDALTLMLLGGESCTGLLSLVRLKGRRLGKVRLALLGGERIEPELVTPDRIDFRVPAFGRLVLNWE